MEKKLIMNYKKKFDDIRHEADANNKGCVI